MAYNRSSKTRALKSLEENYRETNKKRKQKTYCICSGPSEGQMVFCESCENWFHFDCVGITEETLPEQYYCDDCQNRKEETQPEENLEETIVEALSLLSGNGLFSPIKTSDPDRKRESPNLLAQHIDEESNISPPKGGQTFEETSFIPNKKRLKTEFDRASSPTSPNGSFLNGLSPSYAPLSPTSNISSDDSSPQEVPSSPASPPSPTSSRRSHNVTKTYTRKTKKQIAILEKYYCDNPSPDSNLIHTIASETNLPEQKVSRWFYDKRRRTKQLQSTSQ